MKYLIDKKWFKENGSDSVEINRAGKTTLIEITPKLRMSNKFLGMLHSMGKPYVYLTDEAPKKVAPINKSKKVKKDEPRKVKEELQKEVSTETSEEKE